MCSYVFVSEIMISFAQNVENYITTIEITIRSAIIIIKTLDNIDEQLLY